MGRRPACQILSKALDISSATARVAPDPLKPLAILSDTIARRSAVDREDLKPYWKSKKGHIYLGDQQSWSTVLRAKLLGSDGIFCFISVTQVW